MMLTLPLLLISLLLLLPVLQGDRTADEIMYGSSTLNTSHDDEPMDKDALIAYLRAQHTHVRTTNN
jgi:hypothetical protein